MGYIVIKPKKGGVKSEECFTVKKERIYFSKALHEKLGLTPRPKDALILIEKETGMLCFDFKDRGQMPDTFPVSVHVNKHGARTCLIYCRTFIEDYSVPCGKYRIVGKDGSVYKTDCIVKRG